METEGWRIFLWLTVLVAVYAVSARVFGISPSLPGFLWAVALGGAGLLTGRLLAGRFA